MFIQKIVLCLIQLLKRTNDDFIKHERNYYYLEHFQGRNLYVPRNLNSTSIKSLMLRDGVSC